MAPTFVFPSSLRALESENDGDYLAAERPVDVASLRSSDLEVFVKGLSFDLSDRELFCIEDQDVFDRVYSVVKGFSGLPPPCKHNIVECLRSNFSVLLPNVDSICRASLGSGEDGSDVPTVERVVSHRNAFKIYTFLAQIFLAEESSPKAGNNSKVLASARKKFTINSWNWEAQRAKILNLIANSLEINLSLLFGSSAPDENYLAFITKNEIGLFENATLLRDSSIKDALCRIVGTCATKYHYTAQSCASILHLLHKYDFSVTPLAGTVWFVWERSGQFQFLLQTSKVDCHGFASQLKSPLSLHLRPKHTMVGAVRKKINVGKGSMLHLIPVSICFFKLSHQTFCPSILNLDVELSGFESCLELKPDYAATTIELNVAICSKGLSVDFSNIFNVTMDGSKTNEVSQDVEGCNGDEDYEDEANDVDNRVFDGDEDVRVLLGL